MAEQVLGMDPPLPHRGDNRKHPRTYVVATGRNNSYSFILVSSKKF